MTYGGFLIFDDIPIVNAQGLDKRSVIIQNILTELCHWWYSNILISNYCLSSEDFLLITVN